MPVKKASYFIALTLISASALAAGPASLPNAATLNQTQGAPRLSENRPLTAPDVQVPASGSGKAGQAASSEQIVIDRVRFTPEGEQAIGVSAEQAQAVIAGYLHRPLSVSALNQLTDALTRYYQQQGFLLGHALLLPQQVKDGTLVITLVPGRYAGASVSNRSSARDGVVQRVVDQVARKGALIRTRDVQHMALLLQAIPGTQSVTKFSAGDEFGSAAIEVSSQDSKRFSGYVGLDNQGDSTIGKSRVFVGGQANNLLGLGDSLSVNLLDAYERSNLFSGNVDYSVLLNQYGTRMGADYSHLNYQYSSQGSRFRGHSDNYYVYVQHPLVLELNNRVNVLANVGQQFLTYDLLAAESKKTNTYGLLEVNGTFVMPAVAGILSYSLNDTFGNTRGDERGLTVHDRSFNKVGYKLNYQQQIYGPLSFYASVSGQYTANNLDSSQKLILGGPYGLRGYDVGEGSVDSGAIFTVELRNQFHLPRNFDLSLNVFFDQGSGQQYSRPPVEVARNRLNLSDVGVYGEISRPGDFSVRLTVAHKTGQNDPDVLRPKGTQFWVTAVKAF